MRRFMRDEIPAAAEVLKHDGCIAAATDTVFGVCARISEEGQRKLYEVKNRPQTKRFPVMCADAEQLRTIAEVSPAAEAVIGAFMPGPLTVILKKKDHVPSYVNGGMDTLAIRMATSDALAELIRETGCPLFMTSANRSGEKTCTNLDEIELACPDLDGMMEGSTAFGQASTIADCTQAEVRILRPGPLTLEQLKGEDKNGR